ncbi:peptide/nickel transport system substrate-binding protein [Actinokineospora baliensis]|uniref:ABC transporter substrate-binding protein n=1 Tax=Actinokineospora baliensis TaxID=547056 RepID=UPI0027DD159B|nr:ABC transporter substrate-binding protein [Actinokineospora baliensis]MBM7774414.1 peptide/nickel transport system substrate-binding protein [Actinokineospora baliensis]
MKRSRSSMTTVATTSGLLSAVSRGGTTPGAGYDAAVAGVVNPSDHRGGTLVLDNSGDWDSIDPGNTYVAYAWNFARLYARTLTTSSAGEGLVPDLATSLGQVSADGLTWTYRLKPDLLMEDGEPITSAMVRHAIERSASYSSALPIGPVYWRAFLRDNGISTPDPLTITFRLSRPMAEFDHLVSMPQTAPVPPARDTGPDYYRRPLSSGPYQVEDYAPGERLELTRNPRWNPATDPVRAQLVDRVVVNLNVDADEIDRRLFAGEAHLAVEGGGVQRRGQAELLARRELRSNADNPINGFVWYAAISTVLPPLDNVHCRRAVLYAADHAALQGAFGGPVGGRIAPTMLPPTIPGSPPADYDPYGFLSNPRGDLAAATAELAAGGHPNGFATTISFRDNRPKEQAAAEALRDSLARVGIRADLLGYPSGEIDVYPGTPEFVHSRGLGINITGWGADWPSGFGFLYAICHGGAILPTSNSNISELDDPAVNDLLDRVMTTAGAAQRAATYREITERITELAAFLPIVHSRSLLYRNPEVTNVGVNPTLQMYDYARLGVRPR